MQALLALLVQLFRRRSWFDIVTGAVALVWLAEEILSAKTANFWVRSMKYPIP